MTLVTGLAFQKGQQDYKPTGMAGGWEQTPGVQQTRCPVQTRHTEDVTRVPEGRAPGVRQVVEMLTSILHLSGP